MIDQRIASLLFIPALLLALLLGAVRFAFSWQPVYTYAITSYHADEATGLAQAELLRATHEIRNYFGNGRRDLEITVAGPLGQPEALFNEREIAHMRDVKTLVRHIYVVLDLAAAYVALYTVWTLWKRQDGARQLAWAVLRGSLATVAVIIALGVTALTGFDQLFTEFHVLSFSNDFWQLDPTRDHLVQIFPLDFWFDVTIFVGLLALAAAIMLALLAGTVLLFAARLL